MVASEGQIILSLISPEARDIYLAIAINFEQTPDAQLLVSGINGSWARGNILSRQKSPVYGIINDTGSKGGSGYNKYLCHEWEKHLGSADESLNGRRSGLPAGREKRIGGTASGDAY